MRFKSRFWLVIVTATMGMIAYPATDCLAQSSTSGKDNGQTTQRDNPVAEVPILAEASGEASNAIKGFKKPEGWLCELFAAEPMTGNPVAFTIDGKGRVFICESYRQGIGVTDNRSHDAVWLQADLSAMTVEDRIAFHRRLLGEQLKDYESKDDIIRLLLDTDGDNVADESKVFASGFNALEDGTGAGVLVRGGKVYYTNIPNLWELIDRDGDGVSDERVSLANGFGVRVAFRGHDMHGLVNGPDGRLYFSIGDRGYHVQTPDGLLSDPESGAVFRCDPDGSNLEVIAMGLRNPQELAFDDFGNLFTGDNNSDSGDRARWVHVVRGGDTGWRMMYQYIPDRGPFNREHIWYPYDQESPAYTVPPITNLSDGPSGLVCYPGTGLDESYRNTFFLADFRGQASNSGIRMIRMEPDGASFKVVANEEFLWSILATDVDFAPDGAMVVTDWVNGWNGENKGRVYRFFDPQSSKDWIVQETKRILGEGMQNKSVEELENYLVHPDRRVRQESQWELVARNEDGPFLRVASRVGLDPAYRLHGVWGLGQRARQIKKLDLLAAEKLVELSGDADERLAARAMETLGESVRYSSEATVRAQAIEAVRRGLQASSPVIQFAACMASESIQDDSLLPQILKLIEANQDRDPILRHATIMALRGIPTTRLVIALSQNQSPSVRLAAVVALRKKKDPGLAAFLNDASMIVVREVVRAIHDQPQLHGLLPSLAEKIVGVANDDAIVRRVLNANFRLGQTSHALRLAEFAASSDCDPKYRVEALEMLSTWGEPGPNDRVMNRFLPLDARDTKGAIEALRNNLEALAATPASIRDKFLEVGAKYGIDGIGKLVEASFNDPSNPQSRRAAALTALAAIEPDKVRARIETVLADPSVNVRIAALRAAVQLSPDKALAQIEKVLDSNESTERQAAWDSIPSLPPSPGRDQLLINAWKQFSDGLIPTDCRLEAFETFDKCIPESLRAAWNTRAEKLALLKQEKPVAYFDDCLEGGNVDAGRLLFFTKSSLSCVRCHKVGRTGGEVGPNLSEIGIKKGTEYLLEAIVAPNATIADGFKTMIVQDEEGEIFSGILKKEDSENLILLDAQGALITIPVDTIEGRRDGLSSMPADLVKYLNRRELRDLVAYLKSLDGTPEANLGVFEREGGHQLK